MSTLDVRRETIFRSVCAALAFVALIVALWASRGHAFEQRGEDCMKCHTLTKEEIPPILHRLRAPEVKVVDIRMSSVKGLWEVSVEDKGRFFILYVDFSKTYIMQGPLLNYKAGLDLTRQRILELEQSKRIDTSGLSLQNAFVLGKKTAPTKIIVFTDPD